MRGQRRSRPSRTLQEDGTSDQLTVESWPPWLLSDSASSPFVLEGVGVFEGASACEGVRPALSLDGTSPSPVVLHRNWTHEEVSQGSRGVLPMRSVVWSARMGLGNSLRGLIHTFIFALLSSRQLLLSPGGIYGSSIDTMLEGFRGTLDMTDHKVPRVPMYDFNHPVLADGRPVLQGNPNSYDDIFWWADLERRRCVYAALGCSSAWCVHSRIVNLALGQPRLELGAAIESMLVVGASPSQLPAIPPATAQPPAMPPVAAQLPAMPPVAAQLPAMQPPLSHLLATPPSQPQPQQRRGLLSSTNQASATRHSGHSAGSHRMLREQPGSKGLRVKFDVAVHVRTYHKCLEEYTDIPGCQDQGLEHSTKALSIFPNLKEFVSVHRWSCVSNLLGFLLALKGRRIQEKPGSYKGLLRGPGDEEELAHYLERAAQSPGRRPDRTRADAGTHINGQEQPQDEGMWLPEDARAVAEKAQGEAGGRKWKGGTGLTIFLATDSNALRPLFVEYLKPFGTVAHSRVKAVHMAHRGLSRLNRLQSLGEFYIMSRASLVVAYNAKYSSYTELATFYGNSSLIRGVGKLRCDFGVGHIAHAAPF